MSNSGKSDKVVYPYIPNSAPETQRAMMDFIGVSDLWELYEEVPENLRYTERLDIPPAILDEWGMKKHIDGVLGKNTSCS